MTSEHVVARVEHLTWLEPAASSTAEQEAVWMGEEERREVEVGRRGRRRRRREAGLAVHAWLLAPVPLTRQLN